MFAATSRVAEVVPIRQDEPRPDVIGASAAFRRVLAMVGLVAGTDATVLIQGETGTGKEVVAGLIHSLGHRAAAPLIKVNCAAIPSGLLESELFGHERGAYTGALARGIGRFERAHKGTLFLDEIGDLPLELQPKLLRVLQEKQFERLGGTNTIESDVRVVCATHRNLAEMVEQRQFRADLFYRLGVFPIELPPLRERPEDIRPLAEHFAAESAERIGKAVTGLSEEFAEALMRYSWPGNIRELQNVIERAVILATGTVLHAAVSEVPVAPPSTFVTLEQAERSHILHAVEQTSGVIGGPRGAAALLAVPRTTLISKMKRLGIAAAGKNTSALCG